jgi:lipid II:glycine glycyltransferase (peptidoglycan interpeptide bridge formation enzyme)
MTLGYNTSMQNVLSGIPESEWDEQVQALGGHFFQSSHWAAFQIAQGREVLRAQGEGWSWLAAVRKGRGGFNYLYPAYGPTASQKALDKAINSLTSTAQNLQLDFVRLEPTGAHNVPGGRRVKDMQPEYASELDLKPDMAELRRNITSSNRNLINTAEKRGLRFRVSVDPKDTEIFLPMQADTAKDNGFTPQPDAYYRKLAESLMPRGVCRIYIAEHQGQPVASAIGFDWGKTRYYAYAASYHELNRQVKAALPLVWWMISDAKDKGFELFDFGGTAPDDQPEHPWTGQARFKISLGGKTVKRSGTWEIPVKKLKYVVYQVAKRVLPL